MKIIAKREAILSPLQAVIGVVERQQTMPILANVLLAAKGGKLSITATDLEVELVATSDVDVSAAAKSRCRPQAARHLPRLAGRHRDHADARRRAHAGAGPQEPVHAVHPAGGRVPDGRGNQRPADAAGAAQEDFKRLLDKTHFSMAQQDVRYYLNGMLLETTANCCEQSRLTAIVWQCAR